MLAESMAKKIIDLYALSTRKIGDWMEENLGSDNQFQSLCSPRTIYNVLEINKNDWKDLLSMYISKSERANP